MADDFLTFNFKAFRTGRQPLSKSVVFDPRSLNLQPDSRGLMQAAVDRIVKVVLDTVVADGLDTDQPHSENRRL